MSLCSSGSLLAVSKKGSLRGDGLSAEPGGALSNEMEMESYEIKLEGW